MARKKVEVQLLREIESQEEWEDIMAKEGLWVVDVYQEWSGPCDAMVSNFRRIKNELGDDLLHFAMAKCDSIEALEKYRGSCEPCFLFFAAGVLVSYVHGANAPLILRTLTEQLAQEHKVVDGTAERKEVKDPFVANREAADEMKDEEDEDEESGYVPHRRISTLPQDYEEVEEGYTIAIIKPNVVAEGKVDDILNEMKAHGIQVLAQEERQLTEDEAREFYSHLQDEEYFDDLTKFMASGPSHVLVLTKGQEDDSIIKDWRDMLGPPTVEDAQEHAPESLRARYGKAGLMNALHGSDCRETAARELAFFFPHMNAPTIQKKKKEIQRTLALIRPDAFANNRDAILERIKESGFQIALQREVLLTKEQAEEFYKEHAGQPYFEELTTRMSSGPLLALGLAREDAVENWRGMLGPADVEEAKTSAPDSLRAQFAVETVSLNQLHGSDSAEAAQKELQFFFPMEQTVAMIKPDAYGTKDAIIEKIHQAGFRIAARKETTITREIAESFYEDQKDKEYFETLVEHMTSGPTMFMVLSKESAVLGWRQEIGPTDPERAKAEAPESLRAQFGTDVLHNAVHGASSAEEAVRKIESVFGHLEFNPDGGEIQQGKEEEAVSGSPAPEPADVAPEYRQQAEQQQVQQQEQNAEQQQTEEQGETQAETQPETQTEAQPDAQAEEQGQQEQPAEAEENAAQENEEKPAEAEGENADKTEGKVEEKSEGVEKDSSEPTKENGEKEEGADKTEGKVEEKSEGVEKDSSEPTKENGEKEEGAGQAAQQEAQGQSPAAQDKTEVPTEAAKDAAAEGKAEEQKDTQAQDTKSEEPQTEEAKGQEQKEGKAEQKDTTADDKKEGQ